MFTRRIPYSPTATLLRPRLLSRLEESRDRRLTLLIAPAGYGKTTLLRHWLASRTIGRYAWCAFDEDTSDLTAFLTRLITGLARVIPEAVARARDLLSAPHGDPSAALSRLLHDLEAVQHPLLLVLDDVHLVTEEQENRAALERLLRRAPAGFRFVLAARREPPLAIISHLRPAGQILELTAADLCFTAEEATRLVKATLNITLDERLAAQLTARTEGWAVALRLACQAGARYGPDEAERLLRHFGGTVRQLHDYLAYVVLAGQSPDTRSFLRRTSILNPLTPALCDAVLERDDSAALLSSLEQAGLFLFPQDPARTTYRYHTLFREFLQRRLLEVEGRRAVRHLHRRAAAWYLEQRDDEQAVGHLLTAEDYKAAAELLRPLQARLFPTSRYHLMERWLARFPPSFADTHPWLLLCRAKLAGLRGEREQARQLYLRAEPLLHAQNDTVGLHDLYHGLGGLTQDGGDFKTAQALYDRALTYAGTPSRRAVLLGQIARCLYMQGGQVGEALHRLEEAVALAEQSGDLLGRAGLLSLQGRMRSSVGDFKGSLDAFYTALNLLETFGNRHRQVGLLSNIAYHHCLLGQLEEAETTVRRALELARIFDRAGGYDYALNVLGEIHRRRRQYHQARACHLEALAHQRQRNEQYEIAATLNWLGTLARMENNLDEALRYGLEGLAMREKLGTAYETGLSLIDLGATHIALGRLDEAQTLLRRALDIFIAAEARYEQTQTHFYLAVLAQRRAPSAGNDLAHHLTRALTLARSFELGAPPRSLHLFIEEAAWAAPLLAHALHLRLSLPGLDRLLTQLGRPALDALLPLLDDPDPALRTRAATLLGRLKDTTALKPLSSRRRDPDPTVRQAIAEALAALTALPPPPLHIRTLGRFQLRCGDREITRWPRRSARDVFLLLLLRHPGPLAADALAETLWPDSPPDKALQNLRRAISDLRRTLQPELPPGFPSGYLLADREIYTLLLPAGSTLDDRDFEETVRRELKTPFPTGPEEQRRTADRLEAALALYDGDYLPELPYTDWVLARREHLRRLFVAGTCRLARLYLTVGRPEKALAAADRALHREPWDEEATLILMESHLALGNAPAAVRAYENHRDRLRRDLDLAPRDDLTALYNRLRRRSQPACHPAVTAP